MENKHCYNLADFIINKNIDEEDLKKLAELNQIEINIEIGWNRIILDLIIELNENGWNKKVTCIKEKYCELRFYTDSNFNDIIEKYTEKSLKTCIVCGDKGRKQYEGGYESIVCNLHTFERRNKLSFFDKGFILNEKKYYWNIVNRIYTEVGYYNKEELHLKIEFKLKPFLKYFGWVNEYILIGTRSIGFRNFLLNIPTKLSDISNEYIEKFQKIEYCKICGYYSFYNNICECCQNKKWEDFDLYTCNEIDYLKDNQIYWHQNQIGIITYLEKIYTKNPNFQLYFTDEEFNNYISEFDN